MHQTIQGSTTAADAFHLLFITNTSPHVHTTVVQQLLASEITCPWLYASWMNKPSDSEQHGCRGRFALPRLPRQTLVLFIPSSSSQLMMTHIPFNRSRCGISENIWAVLLRSKLVELFTTKLSLGRHCTTCEWSKFYQVQTKLIFQSPLSQQPLAGFQSFLYQSKHLNQIYFMLCLILFDELIPSWYSTRLALRSCAPRGVHHFFIPHSRNHHASWRFLFCSINSGMHFPTRWYSACPSPMNCTSKPTSGWVEHWHACTWQPTCHFLNTLISTTTHPIITALAVPNSPLVIYYHRGPDSLLGWNAHSNNCDLGAIAYLEKQHFSPRFLLLQSLDVQVAPSWRFACMTSAIHSAPQIYA